MKLGKLLLTTLLLLIPFGVQAQVTIPQHVEFELLDPDGRIQYETYGEIQWRNMNGDAVLNIGGDVDSIRTVLGMDEEMGWKIAIDSISPTTDDTGYVFVTVTGKRRRDKAAPFTPYKDSLFVHDEEEVVNTNFLHSLDLLMHDSINVSVGDSLEIYFFRRSLNPHWKSRLTVVPAWSDSLKTSGDTLYSLAVPGDVEYMRWFVKGICSSGVDDFGDSWFGLGYQDKYIGEGWGGIHAVHDSFYIAQDVMKDTSFVHGLAADSLRLATWGNTTTTNLYIEFIRWIGGN